MLYIQYIQWTLSHEIIRHITIQPFAQTFRETRVSSDIISYHIRDTCIMLYIIHRILSSGVIGRRDPTEVDSLQGVYLNRRA
jgi:hypothetical protein